ncbi:hypothetical protein OAN34_01935 [Hyphomicrobiales bacterium]|jgi:hypothetical protein|nr:hypothetical protein [Hyphomicrobiales bacterium]MDG1152424.1 hypothetical protein [Hyphomicrobiales bacterium]MDG1665246.1 hypothetical protein [Hyphomicrobiales bacterium]|tara:strand:+ start:1990 stop:2259 length:270 start_codon:yes stop_codon:yes gene_type:complete
MKKIIIIILTFMVFLPINAKETQSVWSKEEETNADLCQAAIEKGSEVKLKTSKSLERTAYFHDGSFYVLTDYNEFIICFKYSKKDLQIK